MKIDHRYLRAIGVAALASLCWVWGSAQGQPAYSRLVIFGDSLSDAGNVFVATRRQSRAPYDPIPSAPYAIGGHHFSNGSTWVEQLAEELDVASSAHPALRNRGYFSNYAFGGARARMNASSPGLAAQVDMFLADFPAGAPSDALYVLFIGGNDLRDALEAYAQDPSGSASIMILNQALVTLGMNIQRLWLAGARRFLVANAPNIALTPAVAAQGAGAQFLSQVLSTTYNAFLERDVLGPEDAFPGVTISRMDFFGALTEVVGPP